MGETLLVQTVAGGRATFNSETLAPRLEVETEVLLPEDEALSSDETQAVVRVGAKVGLVCCATCAQAIATATSLPPTDLFFGGRHREPAACCLLLLRLSRLRWQTI